MTLSNDRFLAAALAEDGMPITAGCMPEPGKLRPAADDRFLAAALAEDGMPITAGWRPRPGPPADWPVIPSGRAIAKLPRWAKVAFAARCARRVLPLYAWLVSQAREPGCGAITRPAGGGNGIADVPGHHAGWDTTLGKYTLALNEAVGLAERTAATATLNTEEFEDHDAHAAVSGATEVWFGAFDPELNQRLIKVARVAFLARMGAGFAGRRVEWADRESQRHIAQAVHDAVSSIFEATTLQSLGALAAPSQDLWRLVRSAADQNWTDDTPVPPEVFGPLWTGDVPAWWADDITVDLPTE